MKQQWTFKHYLEYLELIKMNEPEGTYFRAIADALSSNIYFEDGKPNWQLPSEVLQKHNIEPEVYDSEHEEIKDMIANFVDEVHDGAYDPTETKYPLSDKVLDDFFNKYENIKYENL